MKILCCLLLVKISIQSKAKEKINDNFSPPENPIHIIPTKAKNKITIDGKLNEEDWQQVNVISGFLKLNLSKEVK